jgi:hypothetical protein
MLRLAVLAILSLSHESYAFVKDGNDKDQLLRDSNWRRIILQNSHFLFTLPECLSVD